MARLNTSRPLLPDHAVVVDDWFSLTLIWRTDRCECHQVVIGNARLTVHVYEDHRVDVVSAEHIGAKCATFWPRDFRLATAAQGYEYCDKRVTKRKVAKLVTIAESKRKRRAPKRSK